MPPTGVRPSVLARLLVRLVRLLVPPLVGSGLVFAVVGLGGCAARPGGPASRAEPVLVERARAGLEPSTTERSRAAVAYASGQVGKRYCWGGIGPSCFDCSGLVSRAWASVGVRLPHSSEAIASALPEVPVDDVRAGDVLWWPGHVALYAGGGWAIEALDARDGVVRRAAKDPRRVFRP
jgi:cell wall-associated NlpC family hydrolase